MVWARVRDTHNNRLDTATFSVRRMDPTTFILSEDPAPFASLAPYNVGMYWVIVGPNLNLKCSEPRHSSTILNTTSNVVATHDGYGVMDFVLPDLVVGPGW